MVSVRHTAERLLLALGVVALVYAVGTYTSGAIFQRYEASLFDESLAASPNLTVTTAQNTALSNEAKAEFPKPLIRTEIRRGDTVGRLEIPRIGLSVMVLHGVETETLDLAAGHVPGTPLPFSEYTGNTAIAGHRDTFFRSLKDIRPDDVIRFSTLHGTYEYAVEWTEIVAPEDTRVIESRALPELTLITCYPFYFVGSAPDRFVVRARYISGG